MPDQAKQIEHPHRPAPRGPNQGLNERWLQQQRELGREEVEALRDIPAAINNAAKAVREFPASVAEQAHLVEVSFYGGMTFGGGLGLGIGAMATWLIGKWLKGGKCLCFAALLPLMAMGCNPADRGKPLVPDKVPDSKPCPPDKPCPGPGPWGTIESVPVGTDGKTDDIEGNDHIAPDGKTEAQVDYPDEQWMKNIGSRIDGAGMCVFTSAEHAFRNQGLDEFRGFRDWCANHYPGGGYPEKLHKLILAYCRAKGIQTQEEGGVTWIVRPRTGERWTFLQYEGGSMDLAEKALAEGILVCTTLYHSPRYGRGVIYHMTNLAHYGPAGVGAILDNNFLPYEWASTSVTAERVKLSGRVWLVAVLRQGPPPPPK